MASTYLTKTFGSAGSSTTWTLSFWVKKVSNGIEQRIFSCDDDASGNNDQWFKFDSADIIQFSQYQSGYTQKIETNRKFRDNSGWYHIVLVWDTTNGTAGDRTRLYVNGVRETSFSSEVQASSSLGSLINNTTYPFEIGRRGLNGTQFFDGLLSHVHFCDGTALAPTVFGETDSETGEWKITTSPSFTMGTNGFTILKDGTTITDQSSNSNDFSLGAGTLTKTEDCPSNVFATFNPLHNTSATISNGNLTAQSTNSNYISGVSTLGTKTGKFYAEFKLIAEGASGESVIGVTALVRPTSAIVAQTGNFGIRNNNGLNYYTSGGTAFTATSQHNNFTINDIIGVALDMDNGRVYFSKNGGWWNGASTWTGTSPSSYITLQTDIYDEFFFECGDAAAGQNANWSANFGNGYFGTTAIASEGTNASGIGKFEYDVPTGGYTALSTKGLNE